MGRAGRFKVYVLNSRFGQLLAEVLGVGSFDRSDAQKQKLYFLVERGENLPEALDLIQRAIAIDPTNPSYLDSLGWAYFRQGRLDRRTCDRGRLGLAGRSYGGCDAIAIDRQR